jgi:hypothetical protein
MFYKIIRITVILAIIFCLVMFSGLGLGWFGLGKILFSFQALLITVGLFSFYNSRPFQTKNQLIKYCNLIVHVISIPAALVAAICVKGEDLAVNYWYWINLILIVSLMINLVTIILKSGINPLLKLIISFIGIAFSVLILLQMAGKFNQGQIIMYGAVAFALLTILAVFFGGQKRA